MPVFAPRRRRQTAALLLGATTAIAVPIGSATAAPSDAGACAPDARIVAFSDALDKTTFAGTRVGGLSALALSANGRRGQALVDNEADTPARLYDVRGLRGQPRVAGVTTLSAADGTPFTGANFDGEGLVTLPGGGFLASSEREPSIRSFGANGRQTGELTVPGRFRVAPDGEAVSNQTFEGLGLSPDGTTLWAGMEGPLAADGTTAEGGARVRLLRYERSDDGFDLDREIGYIADPGLGLTEVQVVDDEQLLVLERGFVAGVGNTVRIFQVFLAGADDVGDEPTLSRDGIRVAYKRLLVDLGDCPTLGATSPGTQANPLLDNVEAMALGGPERGGERDLTLLSDDNFSANQVTRLYRLRVRLPGEPVLEGRATLDALAFQPGPVSGQVGVSPANGVTPPFAGQPVPGFSALLPASNGRLLGMPDNGFGAKGNSADFLLRVYRIRPRFETAEGGEGRIDVESFVSLRDPARKIPFPIVNQESSRRLLTGGDLDLESFQRDARGNLWFGEEFGPLLVNTSPTGRVRRAPIPLPGVKSPQSPDLAAGEAPNLPASGGFEAMAASPDGRTLYPILERGLIGEADPRVRRAYEFDTATASYTGRSWAIRLGAAANFVGDAQVIEGRRLLLIERDNGQGATARDKKLVEVDLDAAPAADGTHPVRPVLDLLRIRDPFGISGPVPAGAVGLGDPFAFPLQSVEAVLPLGADRVIVGNDNNFPGNDGRVPGRPDDTEIIVIRLPKPL